MKNYMKKKGELKMFIERILANKPKNCPRCGQEAIKQDWNNMRCSWSVCRHKFTLIEKTIFYGTKTKPWKILRILDLWLLKMPVGLISSVVRVNKKVISRILKNVEGIIPKYYEKLGKIGSFNTIVEIDESKFGKRKYNRGHSVEGVWVLGMVERSEDRKIILMAVDDRKKDTLLEKIRNSVDQESDIFTDCWKSYNGLNDIFNSHSTVNHSLNFVDPTTGVHTNTIEGTWFAVKSQIPNRNRTKNNVNLYLLRFMLIRNSKNNALEELINLF